MVFRKAKIKKSLFAAVIFSFLLFNSAVSGSNDVSDKILSLLESSHILVASEQEQLFRLVSELDTNDEEILYKIVSMISTKVDRDKIKLKRLLSSLEELIQSRYSKIIARAKENDQKPGIDAFVSYEQAFGERFIVIFDCDKCNKADNYKRIIKNNVQFLMENEDFISIPVLWRKLSRIVEVPYKRWSKKYNELEKELTKRKKEHVIYYEAISFEETEFVKTFDMLQQLLKQIQQIDAPDFVFHERNKI